MIIQISRLTFVLKFFNNPFINQTPYRMTYEEKSLLERDIYLQVRETIAAQIPEDYTLAITIIKKSQPISSDILAATQIRKTVCEYLALDIPQILERNRDAEIVKARRYVAFLIQRYTRLSANKIGEYCGLTDHSSVLYHIRELKNTIPLYEDVAKAVSELSRLVEQNIKL